MVVTADMTKAFQAIFATPEEDAIRQEIEDDGAVQIR